MFLTFGVMIVWPKKKSDGKEMKKAYCGFRGALRRPWKSREKKLNSFVGSHAGQADACIEVVSYASDSQSSCLLDIATVDRVGTD
jgi:hypothetical protein